MVTIRRLFGVIRLIARSFRQYRWRFLIALVLGFVGGLLGSIGIGAAIPLFSLFVKSAAPVVPDGITRTITTFFALLHLPLTPPLIIGLIALLFVSKAAVQFFAKYLTDSTIADFEEHMRGYLFTRTIETTWPYLLNQKVGYIERILLNDIQMASGILGQIGSGILIGTSFIMYATVAMSISWTITTATLVFGAILFFLSKPIFSRSRRTATRLGVVEKSVNHFMAENLIGAKIIKAYHQELPISIEGKRHFNDIKVLRKLQSFYAYSLSGFIEPIGFLFIAVMFLWSYHTPTFNIASFAVVIYLVQRMFGFVQTLQGEVQTIYSLVPYLKTVTAHRRATIEHREESQGTKSFSFAHELSFRDVTFSYQSNRPVLDTVSFTVPKGSMLGIIGMSGSGKTTIADLLLRLFTPQSGAITLDGTPATGIKLSQWRRHMSYVSQDIFLFNDTIENNIRFYEKRFSHEDVVHAAALANLSELVVELPEGLSTIVGERGVKLSGGQRQRIALARALIRRPDILILDEATSSLDTTSETLIQEAIHTLKGNVTIIVIAHRLSTIMSADHVIQLEQGKIVRQGRPDEVVAPSTP